MPIVNSSLEEYSGTVTYLCRETHKKHEGLRNCFTTSLPIYVLSCVANSFYYEYDGNFILLTAALLSPIFLYPS